VAIAQEAGQLIQIPLPGMPFHILVTGWRDWPREAAYVVHAHLERAIKDLAPNATQVVVTEGQSPYGGVDEYAYEWALARQPWAVPDRRPADFKGLGRAAGPKRNGEMVALGPDVCLAFPGPGSRGTVNCMKQAEAAQILVRTVNWDPAFLLLEVPLDDTPTSPYPGR
jgi:hypothetical protein